MTLSKCAGSGERVKEARSVAGEASEVATVWAVGGQEGGREGGNERWREGGREGRRE